MNTNLADNNKLKLAGKVMSEPVFSYEAYDEKFYEFTLEVPRLSDNSDKINCIISERILDNIALDAYVTIEGQIRTFNEIKEDKKKLLMFAFVRDIKVITKEELEAIENPNEVELTGFICKQPTYRETPFGREISDVLFAVNRAYRKSDYIPSIAWGRNAKYCSKLPVGTNVKVTGRLQSREYKKTLVEDGVEKQITKTAFELSLNRITLVSEEE